MVISVISLLPEDEIADDAGDLQQDDEDEAGVAAALQQLVQVSGYLRHVL